MDTGGSKREIRVQMLGRRAGQSRLGRSLNSGKICSRISRLSVYRRAESVLLYFPIRGEVDVLPLFRSAIRAGKTVAFPRVEGRRISFYPVKSLSELKPGRYGIPEPSGKRSRLAGKPGLIVVPGTAFGTGGERLGFGGGYYDRALRKREAAAVGVAFNFQVLAGIPQDPGDVRLDALVTPERVFFPAQH